MSSAMTGTFTAADGVPIVFDQRGDGPAVVLQHGFAADADLNWVQPGIVAALLESGRRVITFDARGHGRSGKPHDSRAYDGLAMVDDVRNLLSYLEIDSIDVVGYSMGGLVAAALTVVDPRVRSVVLGGVGRRLVMDVAEPSGGEGSPGSADDASSGVALTFAALADALETDDPDSIADEQGRAFRAFADITGADKVALAALQRSRRQGVDVRSIAVPVLVLAGDRDELVGDPRQLAEAIPGAEVALVHGDHLQAVFEPAFRDALVQFLDRASPVAPR